MKNGIKIIIAILLILIIAGGIIVLSKIFNTNKPKEKEEILTNNNSKNGITTVLSLEDEISNNTIWCGTFQLIWNDLKNDLAKQFHL